MEQENKIKVYLKPKDGNFGKYWGSKVTITKPGDYYLSVNDDFKDGQYGVFKGASLVEMAPKETKPF